MMEISGYDIGDVIYDGRRSRVLSGARRSDGRPVVIKLAASSPPAPDVLVRMRREFEIGASLAGSEAVSYLAFSTADDHAAIVMDDGGVTLDRLIPDGGLPLGRFLDLAIELVDRLGRVHKAGVIHMDIKPANVLVAPKDGLVRLCDFDLSRRTDGVEPIDIQQFEGTLAYISPEQTGRMDRPVDHRSDFYSLGATFYEMLTDALPFPSGDAMELVHCHIARRPASPRALRPDVPEPVAEIVLKLLSKSPGDRYGTARGLHHDLSRCRALLASSGLLPPFPLGESDVSGQLLFPDTFYGRSEEAESLVSAFEEAAVGSARMVLVRGWSGIGKTALIHQLQRPILEQRGSLCSGKFDQLQRNVPYSGIIAAVRGLIRSFLADEEASVAALRARIRAAVGPNGGILIRVIPELELIIGPQPEPIALEPAESEARFRWLSHAFIAALASKEQPLVVFLDDLQWADDASLRLIQALMVEGQARYLLLIGAYRDNEVDAGHPLSATRSAIEKACPIREIALGPLGPAEVSALIADVLHQGADAVADLSDLVFKKTWGNPFFVRELLKVLRGEGLLVFDEERGRWTWDIAAIRAKSFSDNVVELMASELKKLGAEAQRALGLAAAVGNRFDLGTLAIVAEADVATIAGHLREALGQGMVVPIAGAVAVGAGAPRRGDREAAFRFLHDRVQQAAYSLIPEEQRPRLHLAIGRFLLRDLSAEQRESRLFEIVNHLNYGVSLIDDRAERLELARLNDAAARRAKAASAYVAAMGYAGAAFALLGPRPWDEHYPLALSLREQLAEAAFLSGDFDRMDAVVSEVVARARDVVDRMSVYRIRIFARTAQHRSSEAVDDAIGIAETLGIRLSRRPSKAAIARELLATKWLLRGKDREALLALPRMTDRRHLAAMGLLSSVSSATFLAAPEMFPLLIFHMARLSASGGNCAYSCPAYASYGMITAMALGDVEGGLMFDEVARRLVDVLGPNLKTMALMIHGGFMVPLKRHVRDSFEVHLEGYRAGVEMGDLESAAFHIMMLTISMLMAGVPLGEIAELCAAYQDPIRRCRVAQGVVHLRQLGQFMRNLAGKAEDPAKMKGPDYDEDEQEANAQATANHTNVAGRAHLQLWLAYLRRDFQRADDRCRVLDRYAEALAMNQTPIVSSIRLLQGLTRLQIHASLSPAERIKNRWRFRGDVQYLKKWAAHAPMNHLHHLHLLQAEEARTFGNDLEAMQEYDRSIALARQHRYIHDEALANELAARFYMGLGRTRVAAEYLKEARRCFVAWGAGLKVRLLDEEFHELIGHAALARSSLDGSRAQKSAATTELAPESGRAPPPSRRSKVRQNTHSGSSESETFGSGALDLGVVFKASQAIAEEIILDSLLKKLIRMLIENAGAERGLLILEHEGRLVLEVECVASEALVILRHGTPVDGASGLSAAIVNYVARTGEAVVLHDATAEGLFSKDPYLASRRPRSVLSVPLVNRGKLIAIAYMENNLTAGAFTADRLEVLRLLSSQMALSIHNARLYSNLEKASEHLRASNEQLAEYSQTLEQRVDERTRELWAKNEELRTTQKQLVVQEKLASLGALTAGIAHELKNPLNFINNFAELTVGLAEDLAAGLGAQRDRIAPEALVDLEETLDSVRQNASKIDEHGKRANQIINGMLVHARAGTAPREAADLNALVAESVDLAFHGMRAKDAAFDVSFRTSYDPSIGEVEVAAPDLGRVFTNVISNAGYAMQQKKRMGIAGYAPEIKVSTVDRGDRAEVRIRDNGTGIPDDVVDKVFHPFFTTKPPGEGTGLGLSISHDIVVEGHQGEIRVETVPGSSTEFVITLPKRAPGRGAG
jgi:predicted ATPase/signal transduction histidine kinase